MEIELPLVLPAHGRVPRNADHPIPIIPASRDYRHARPQSSARSLSSWEPSVHAGNLAIGVIAIAALYFARDVFVPLALAVLLSFALGPLVALLRRWYFGRVPSVIAAVLLAFLVIFGVVLTHRRTARPPGREPAAVPNNITDKIHSLRSSATGSGILGRASGILRDLSNEITKTTPPTTARPSAAASVAPRGD